jgi:chromosome segregation ATPase
MTGLIESDKLIELVIEKHRRLLDTYNTEFSDLDTKLNAIKQKTDEVKKEKENTESRISVLNEKYHLLFHQAKKLREEIFMQVIEKMRASKAVNLQDIVRLSGRVEELEKKVQDSKNIEDEEKIIVELKRHFYDFESGARKAGMVITCKMIVDKLNEANSSHKEFISLESKPKEQAGSAHDFDKQTKEIEGRYNWLKHRIESHNSASAYWEKQKGGIKVD